MDERIDRVLKRLEKQERYEQENPDAVPGREKMLAITRDIGLFYNILLRFSGTRRILEVGTSTGYSTIWFAEAVRGVPGSQVITIEQEDAKISRARKNFHDTGLECMIEMRRGLAAEILCELVAAGERFDFVFIDADKERVIEYFDLSLRLLRTGGIIGIDNIIKPEKFSPYMTPLIDHARAASAVRSVIVPIDNGELLCVRLGAALPEVQRSHDPDRAAP